MSVPHVCSHPSPSCPVQHSGAAAPALVPIAHGRCLVTAVAVSQAPTSAAAPLGTASDPQQTAVIPQLWHHL